MKLINIIDWVFNNINELKDAIMGSLVYSVYAHVFQNKPVVKNIVSFFIGVIFSTYLSEPVYHKYPEFKLGFISFIMGLLGMKLVEVIMDTN